MKKKATPTGICNASHCAVGEREVGERHEPVGHGAEPAAAGTLRREHQVARPAGAHQRPRLEVDDVAVLVGDQLGAQLAALARARLGLQRHVADPLEDRAERLRCTHPTAHVRFERGTASRRRVEGDGSVWRPSEIGVATP